jgi:hypothetical protein
MFWLAAALLIQDLHVATAESAPKIDGVLDDAWKKAAVSTEFKLPYGDAPEAKTKLHVMQDDKRLYIAVECFGDDPDELVANIEKHDEANIWMDDDVELFLDPTGQRKSYYQIIVNTRGTTWDAYHSQPREDDLSWEPKYESAVKVTKKNWTVEFAIPWSSFSRTEKLGADWAFNVLRMRQAGQELIYWSPVHSDSSHTPEKFGKLSGVAPKK